MREALEPLVVLGEGIIHAVWSFCTGTIELMGYWGIALLMAIESFNIPLPSEMILTAAGVMVHDGKLDFHLASLFGAIGCVIGSIPSYFIGYHYGEPFIKKYGKWLLVSEHDLIKTREWTQKYGDLTFFICRMLPVVRTFISLPAGVLKARFWPFIFYTFIGSWIWSYGLVYAGFFYGANLAEFKKIWHKFDFLILGILFVLGCLYIWKHIKHFKEASTPAE